MLYKIKKRGWGALKCSHQKSWSDSCVPEHRPLFTDAQSSSLSLDLLSFFFFFLRGGWLTCLPPFFGLCWAPLLGPALLQALQAPLVPAGAPGPDAHRQPCSHLKGEARQLSEGRLMDFSYSRLHSQHTAASKATGLDSNCVSHWYGA